MLSGALMPDRYWVTIFNHENYYKPAPTGASIGFFFKRKIPKILW
jgi:hypothetical protein